MSEMDTADDVIAATSMEDGVMTEKKNVRAEIGRLNGKVAIVTGGGASGELLGTGRAICELLAREGARIVVLDRVAAAADITVKAIRQAGGEARAVIADITLESDCRRCVEDAMASYGRLDILVNNVGVENRNGHPRLVEIVEEEWDHVFAVDLKAALMMAKYAIPAMTQGGSLVHISSVGSRQAWERYGIHDCKRSA